MLTLKWDDDKSNLVLIDQRKLPANLTYYYCKDLDSTAVAIKDMVVRGAPAIGATAAFGIALAAMNLEDKKLNEALVHLRNASDVLSKTRPTAVNLQWALERMMKAASNYRGAGRCSAF